MINQVLTHQSFYLTMPDGVDIAVEVSLPDGIDEDYKVPAVILLTRYWRAMDNAEEPKATFCTQHGFAYIGVDVRGTGASFGQRSCEWSLQEMEDFPHIINWVAKQAWSNGSVATIGSSYPGNTSEFAMYNAPQALKASIPMFTDFDPYAFLFFPGGLYNKRFIDPWSAGLYALDINSPSAEAPVWADYENASVQSVANDVSGELRQKAAELHLNNTPIAERVKNVVFRDEIDSESLDQHSDCWVAPHQLQDNARLKEIPSYHWNSFFDAGTAAGAIARFMGSDAPMRSIIGYWRHGATEDCNPYDPLNTEPVPSADERFLNRLAFLEPLKNPDKGEFSQERALYYFTAGENAWKKTDTWPPQGVAMQRYYFAGHNQLQISPPSDKEGKDSYTVNFDAGTGMNSRWCQLDNVYYGDRAETDKLLLTYTSEPLQCDTEITGHPIIHLHMSSSEPDGAVIAYLEDVAPDGSVTMLGEGNLRLLHRKVSTDTPPYPMFGPYHSFKQADAMLMEPGKVESVTFTFLPLSALIRKGHAIRIAIAGHDKDSFSRVPESGTPVYDIYRSIFNASYIDLPVMSSDIEVQKLCRQSPF